MTEAKYYVRAIRDHRKQWLAAKIGCSSWTESARDALPFKDEIAARDYMTCHWPCMEYEVFRQTVATECVATYRLDWKTIKKEPCEIINEYLSEL